MSIVPTPEFVLRIMQSSYISAVYWLHNRTCFAKVIFFIQKVKFEFQVEEKRSLVCILNRIHDKYVRAQFDFAVPMAPGIEIPRVPA